MVSKSITEIFLTWKEFLKRIIDQSWWFSVPGYHLVFLGYGFRLYVKSHGAHPVSLQPFLLIYDVFHKLHSKLIGLLFFSSSLFCSCPFSHQSATNDRTYVLMMRLHSSSETLLAFIFDLRQRLFCNAEERL